MRNIKHSNKAIGFLLLLIIIDVIVFAQTGIGTTTLNASSRLDVSAKDKGFLPSRIALTATNVGSPITSPA